MTASLAPAKTTDSERLRAFQVAQAATRQAKGFAPKVNKNKPAASRIDYLYETRTLKALDLELLSAERQGFWNVTHLTQQCWEAAVDAHNSYQNAGTLAHLSACQLACVESGTERWLDKTEERLAGEAMTCGTFELRKLFWQYVGDRLANKTPRNMVFLVDVGRQLSIECAVAYSAQ